MAKNNTKNNEPIRVKTMEEEIMHEILQDFNMQISTSFINDIIDEETGEQGICEVRLVESLLKKNFDGEVRRFITNSATGGLSHSVWQDLFKKFHEVGVRVAGTGWKTSEVKVPGYAKQFTGKLDMMRQTFGWGNLTFKNAVVTIEPNKTYYFPEMLAVEIERYIRSKTIDPSDFGLKVGKDGETYTFDINSEGAQPLD